MKSMLLISSVMAPFWLFQIQDPSIASAQDNFSTRIALHVTPHFVPTSKQFPTLCSANPMDKDGLDCSTFTTRFTTNDFPGPDTYVVAGQVGSAGTVGVSFGIDYDPAAVGGVADLVGWTRCTDGLDFPSDAGNGPFPAEGGGIRVTWVTCQNSLAPTGQFGVHTLVGVIYTYVYAAGSLKITPNYGVSPPEFAVTDCALRTINILDVLAPVLYPLITGRIDFGEGGYGYTPCSTVSTEPSTWSKIKSRYKGSE